LRPGIYSVTFTLTGFSVVRRDGVYRLNPATSKIIKYLLPTVNVNIRRIDVDRSPTPNVWVSENLKGKIVGVEPL